MITASVIEAGDEVLAPGPSYPSYMEFTKFYGGVPVTYRTIEEENWQPDIDDLRKKITPRTKYIAVINPNNPTGALYSDKVLKQIADLAGEYNLFLISDEIYDLMTFEGKHHSPASLAKDIPMILFNGFSKIDLLPGWRLGRDQGRLQQAIEVKALRERSLPDGGHRGAEASEGPSCRDDPKIEGQGRVRLQEDQRDPWIEREEAAGRLLHVPEGRIEQVEDRQGVRARHASERARPDRTRIWILPGLW
jgi:hypothetical protein